VVVATVPCQPLPRAREPGWLAGWLADRARCFADVGGLNVCRHGWHLLDADQELPWPDQPLVY
jgi:hypothetical protein